MEGSTLDLLEDAEDLMFDTRKRLGSCVDLESSLEIRREEHYYSKYLIPIFTISLTENIPIQA